MSEWITVLAVFWLLWGVDGLRVARRAVFSFRAGARGRNGSVSFGRAVWPSLAPWGWRVVVPDVPLALSEEGIANVPAGAAGRPATQPETRQAWRWADITAVGVAGEWIHVNGRRFCPDTGHVTAPELWALVGAPTVERARRIDSLLARWLRPAQVVRRERSLRGRTRLLAGLNAAVLLGMAVISVYLVGDVAGRVPAALGERLGMILPWVVLLLLGLHLVACVLGWRVVGRLLVAGRDGRKANLASALLLPPQALRLRALAGEGYVPAQHPLAVALALASRPGQAPLAFAVLADLRWPRVVAEASALERDIVAGFRRRLEPRIEAMLAAAAWSAAALLRPPAPDQPSSCAYCPRCGDQFVAGPRVCPQGILLQPLRPGTAEPHPPALRTPGIR
jgi:hypothetical protein